MSGTVRHGPLSGFQYFDDSQSIFATTAGFDMVYDAVDEMFAFLAQWLGESDIRDGNIPVVIAELKFSESVCISW